jgi:very-long-chain ceramide synthase
VVRADDGAKQIAKILKYSGSELSCNIAFGVFLLTWFIARHIIYNFLCWSIYRDVPAHMAYGCYSGATGEMLTTNGYPDRWAHLIYPFWNLDGPICMNPHVKWIFLSSLLALQVLSLIWFGMIVRIAVGVIRTGNAEDTRSDDEEETDEKVDVDGEAGGKEGSRGSAVTADCSSSDQAWRVSNSSTRTLRGRGRVRLGDQSDRKALLGRIGCDKPT